MSHSKFKNGNRHVNRLTKLNFDRKLLYRRMQSIDESIFSITLSLLKKVPDKKNAITKIYDCLARLNGQKTKLELKMLKTDVEISDIAKNALLVEV
jgi:hypothetical protein